MQCPGSGTYALSFVQLRYKAVVGLITGTLSFDRCTRVAYQHGIGSRCQDVFDVYICSLCAPTPPLVEVLMTSVIRAATSFICGGLLGADEPFIVFCNGTDIPSCQGQVVIATSAIVKGYRITTEMRSITIIIRRAYLWLRIYPGPRSLLPWSVLSFLIGFLVRLRPIHLPLLVGWSHRVMFWGDRYDLP